MGPKGANSQEKTMQLQEKQQSSETETETENEAANMTPKQYQDSIKWQIGSVKDAAKGSPGKGKTSSEMIKRIIVGFFILSIYVTPMYIHPFADMIHSLIVVHFCVKEAFKIDHNSQDYIDITCRYLLQALVHYYIMTRYGIFERGIVERSGYSARDYPNAFYILYERNTEISAICFSCIFLLGLFFWRIKSLKNQLRKTIGRLSFMVYISFTGSTGNYSYIYAGRWWTYFPILSVVLNDAAAYFVGKAFGKHHLLRISPNKTIEGFFGAFVSNVAATYIMAVFFMKGHFWICAPKRFNYGLFESVECDQLDKIYVPREFQLPISVMGNESVIIAPAVLYTVIYGMFASTFTPFIGFFASGFKRAVGLKDFGATLPGHGGFMDRYDCVSFMFAFNFFFLNEVIMRDDLMLNQSYKLASELEGPEKNLIANQIAERLGLPPI